MKFTYDFAKAEDIDDIMTIETSCFTPEEAASRASMIERIALISDTFLVARNEDGRVVGMVVGPTSPERYLTDDLFEHSRANLPTDKVQTVVSLAVLADYRKHGLAGELLKRLAEVDRSAGREIISLTCLESLVPYYEAHGFVNEGVSASQHAGETWYNMVFSL
ncbi:GNAT family N-acetyltransferase [Lactococcus nasutitermitis]|uniref:GNAT family N-acetyltransferase n=1 Tax=Lactococcus nasutitermitis TaxID=1652957 RepID=A0ABV9JBB1_9LACT|nr:GNAT family N-acetyltransferase [Lactococcus nasutitermitis]